MRISEPGFFYKKKIKFLKMDKVFLGKINFFEKKTKKKWPPKNDDFYIYNFIII